MGMISLDAVTIAVSLFNTILLFWLGLTVLLNAERRTGGVWLVGGGLLMGAAFFVSHTVILGHELTVGNRGLDFWWQVGWVPVIVAPFAWYVVTLWYAGYWNRLDARLRRRHRAPFILACAGAIGLIALMLVAHPLPTYTQIVQLDLSATPAIGGVPLLFIVYPVFMVLCILLSIDALRHPEPPQRMMGDLARQRSRPWLLATAAVLLVVSVLVAVFIARAVICARAGYLTSAADPVRAIALYDVVLASLIAIAVVMLGQAIVSYEVFTGKALPRRGFFRHWRNAIILAAGYATLIGGSLAVGMRPIYSLLLTALLMIVFYALFSWRSFVEREQFMARLRPFLTSQRLMQRLVNPEDDAASRANALFDATCRDVLSATQARLVPLGVLAPLAGPPLSHPRAATSETPPLPSDLFPSPEIGVAPLDSASFGGLRWAIPLWGERGLIGALLLGEKQDGGLYTQEEMEIARASGERIVDMLAGEEMARRLMALQRRRLAETRVMDLRTRRVLHDEVLPTLHTAVLRLGSLPRENSAVRDAITALTDFHRQIADLIHAPGGALPGAPDGRGLVTALRDMVQDEHAGAFDSVAWRIPDGDLPALAPLTQEVVFGAVREAVRNTALHGRGGQPDRPLNLTIEIAVEEGLSVRVTDDGVGMAHPSRAPAMQDDGAAPPPGSRGGLALHSTMMAIVGGYLTVEAPPGGGTRVTIALPPDALAALADQGAATG